MIYEAYKSWAHFADNKSIHTLESSNLKNLIALKEIYSLALKNDIKMQKFVILDVLSNDSSKIHIQRFLISGQSTF